MERGKGYNKDGCDFTLQTLHGCCQHTSVLMTISVEGEGFCLKACVHVNVYSNSHSV